VGTGCAATVLMGAGQPIRTVASKISRCGTRPFGGSLLSGLCRGIVGRLGQGTRSSVAENRAQNLATGAVQEVGETS